MQGTATTRRKTFFNRRMGPLQRQLRQGEYGMFQFSPMFESDFVQVSKQGGPIEIHNQEQIVTVGITSTNPALLIPNVLLLARPIVPPEEHSSKFRAMFCHHPPVRLELTRLFPLRFVKISIHNLERKQLRLKLVSGRTYYLQLCPQSNRREDLFDAWVRIVQLLRPPSEINLKEQKQKNKPLKSQAVPLAPPVKPKSPPPQRKSPPPTPEKKEKKTVVLAPQITSAKEEEKKKSPEPAAAPSESPPFPQVKTPSPIREDIHEVISPPSTEKQEVEEKLEKLKETKENPHHKGHAGERSSPHSKRTSDRKNRSSRSRSEHRGTSGKPSKFFSLIRSCTPGYKKEKKQSSKAHNKGKKRHAE